MIRTVKKIIWAPSLEYNLLSTIFLSKKCVEVFLCQFQMPSEISKLRELFEVVNIVDDQYVVCTTGFSPNNISEASIINSMTSISIQTWHRWMGHLGYQNFLRLSKIANAIDIKYPISAEIFGDCMKRDNKGNHLMSLCQHQVNILTIFIVISAGLIQSFGKIIGFILALEMVQQKLTTLN